MAAIAERPRARIQYAPGIELTAKQRSFVTTLVRVGCSATKAAELAGYSDAHVSAYDLQRLPHVAAAIRMERERYISGELANVATGTLRAVMEDKASPAAAKVAAARTVLEMSRDLGKAKSSAEDERPLSEYTAYELAAMIDKWTAEKAQLATPIPAGEVEILDSAQARAQV